MNIFKQGDSFLQQLTKVKHVSIVTFFVAFLEATISPILPEAFLLILLAYRKDLSWKFLAFISSLGSSVGALAMYFFGAVIYNSYGEKILQVLHGQEIAKEAQVLFIKNAFIAQFFAALTPLPDRVFSFLAGAFSVSLVIVFIATFVGRLCRVVPVAYLSYTYGEEARNYIKKNSKRVSRGIILLVVLFVVCSYFM